VAWSIVPFAPAHARGVQDLIVGIQRGEFGLAITAPDQPDLQDIPGFYLNGEHGPGGFWVALDDGGAVAGTIALRNIGLGAGHWQGALRKMFVARAQRGSGLAPALLAELVAWCRAANVGELFLGTTDRFLAAHRFYEKNGFTRVEKSALPAAFPVMAVDTVFYARRLSPG